MTLHLMCVVFDSQRDLGPTMAPLNAFLAITGIETVSVRMKQHVVRRRGGEGERVRGREGERGRG